MRALIQRVRHASVVVEGETVGQIQQGFLVFLGVTESDTDAEMELLADKMLKLRIFPDADGKTNCSLMDVEGSLLIISQFTLCADCRKGTRPSFSNAASPQEANRLYEAFVARCRERVAHVDTGVFGAHMDVSLENDGPFTIWLDTDDLKKPRNH
ncbi:MAG: D-tyrosyl-tRNA(Tyr) deacylase [Oscillospiraceae bacterium]|jgi:D-tyrosyl-tRNA(Tyr) deacylase|nr:D-tyrosyl-tRNA(Tyr) deacylase [Oscillospiraceae bacterium]